MKTRSAAIGADARSRESAWTDARLVRECLRGNEEAWAALIERYQNLIFSLPIKRGFTQDEAGEVFQRVCLLLLAELKGLRDARALPMWLIRVTSHECARWYRQERPYRGEELSERQLALALGRDDTPEEILAQLTEEQSLREALRTLSPRCQRLVRMLFYESEARPYREVARSLGLPTGSIGALRAGCLKTLRHRLHQAGLAGR